MPPRDPCGTRLAYLDWVTIKADPERNPDDPGPDRPGRPGPTKPEPTEPDYIPDTPPTEPPPVPIKDPPPDTDPTGPLIAGFFVGMSFH
jgi:hypothetical protein